MKSIFIIWLIMILILAFLNINIVLTSSTCIEGKNCPLNRGACIQQKCVCLYGYATLITTSNQNDIKYCNYRQNDRVIPFLLEMILPSIGLFFLGRGIHGLIKICTFISLVAFFCGVKNRINFLIAICYPLLYVFDLIFLGLAIYKDGNGVPLL